MNMHDRALRYLDANFKKRVILDPCAELGPLLTRWFVYRSNRVGVFVHLFHRSDNDRHFHDHPWDFCSLLLSGGYVEHTPAGAFWRRRFSVLFRPAKCKHRVEIKRPTWTLVVRLRHQRQWGFWTESGWVNWITYDKEWCE
jgi:hypothetical protein